MQTDFAPELISTSSVGGAITTRRVRNEVARTDAAYEAGSTARRLAGWRPPTTTPNGALLGTLSTLRDRSRNATRNDGYAKGVIDKLVTNLIGTGIKPLSQAPDPALRQQIQALFLRWTDESDADGQLDFYGQQAQVTRCWLEAGETFVRDRLRLPIDGLSVPFQIQVLEPELCPYLHNVWSGTGNKVRAGIEFSPIGKREAYYFHPSRPDQDDFDASQLRRIPADGVHHVYDPLRAGQLRGLPHLTQALIRLHEIDKTDDAVVLRQQLSNMFVAFLTRNAGLSDSETFDPLTGKAIDTSNDPPDLKLEPGIFQQLEPGEDVKFSEPPDMQAGYGDFMRLQLRGISVATGVPYEVLTGDMTGMNDRTVRVVLNEFKRRMQMLQHQVIVYQFCRPVWSAWIARAFLSGALPMPADYPTNAAAYEAVKWTPHRWAYIHPVQDVEAQVAEMRAGLASRQGIVSENGEDAEQIDAEQAEDNERADELGLTYSSDGRQPANGKVTPTPADEPVPVGAAA